MLDKEEWAVIRYHNEYAHLEPHEKEGRPEYELLIRKVYQWEAQYVHINQKWEYVMRGLKSNEEAIEFVNKFGVLLTKE